MPESEYTYDDIKHLQGHIGHEMVVGIALPCNARRTDDPKNPTGRALVRSEKHIDETGQKACPLHRILTGDLIVQDGRIQ